jgi:dynein heavy chain
MAKRDAFTDELDEFVTQAEAFATYGELDRMAENVQKLSDLEAKMADARTRAEALSSEEELLGFPRSQFPQLEEVPKTLAPYKALWSTAQEFSKNSYQWLNGPMTAIDPEVVEGEAKALWKASARPAPSRPAVLTLLSLTSPSPSAPLSRRTSRRSRRSTRCPRTTRPTRRHR